MFHFSHIISTLCMLVTKQGSNWHRSEEQEISQEQDSCYSLDYWLIFILQMDLTVSSDSILNSIEPWLMEC